MRRNKPVYSSYHVKGLTGLANLGNTCFMNSCMQVLSNTPELNKILNNCSDMIDMNALNEQKQQICDYKNLLKEWKDLKEMMWSDNAIIGPRRFQKTVQIVAEKHDKDLFTGFAQNDLPEFLLFIIDAFHNALHNPVNVKIKGVIKTDMDNMAVKCYNVIKTLYEKEYSVILDHFYGLSLTYITNQSGKVVSVRPEPYMMLNLPIPQKKNITLEDCMNLYCEDEVLDGENMWFNEKTGEKEVVARMTKFWSFPKILIIDLKRFNNNNNKRQELIRIPVGETFDLSQYIYGYNSCSYVYQLYAVCNHEGGALGGHYTATIKKEDGKWYNYNDTTVSEVSEKKVVSTKAYCLFFKKIS